MQIKTLQFYLKEPMFSGVNHMLDMQTHNHTLLEQGY